MSRFYPLELSALERDTPDSVVLTLTPPPEARALFRHRAGQHLTLRTWLDGKEVRRSYSVCNVPDEPHLLVAIKRVAGGAFSEWAHGHLRPGAVIEAAPPAGGFGLPVQAGSARHYAGFAAGSGIAPILSILHTTLLHEPRSRFTLVYCSRNLMSLQFRERLAELKDRYPARLSLLYLFSGEPQDVELFNGRLDRARCLAILRTCLPAACIDHAFICGPAGMMAAVSQALRDSGMAAARIRIERFGDGAAPAAGTAQAATGGARAGVALTLRLDGTQRRLELAAADNLLDALLQSGVAPPYSCKAGVCAACRCRVLDGEVAMQEPHALDAAEVAAGYVLSCRSRALTPELTLSFD